MAEQASVSDPQKLHRDICAGYLLPTQGYSDPAIFQAELEAACTLLHSSRIHCAHATEWSNREYLAPPP